MKHYYTDTQTGVTFPSDDPNPPAGCIRSADAKTSARPGSATARDAAPASGGYLADSLRACTAAPGFLVDRVNRCLIDAQSATSAGARTNALDNLRAAGRQLATRAFTAKDASDREAMNRAAAAVSAAADALSASAGGPVAAQDANPRDARAAMIAGLSDGWTR